MLVTTVPIPYPLTLQAEPLTPASFAPFGSVLTNPAPTLRPHEVPAKPLPSGHGAVSANQGTAIQYRALAPPLRDLYAQAPSRAAAEPRTTMFVCQARDLLPAESLGSSNDNKGRAESDGGFFEVKILERHPFTTQTFIPLSVPASSSTRYLVTVALSLAPGSADKDLPAPTEGASGSASKPQPQLPGRGLPDLTGLRAFIATGAQAVTYGAGTWHAPMAALGPRGSAIDFVVVQFANDVPVEDCQEVALGGENEKGKDPRILVKVSASTARLSKL
ncbi:uncharacterized protein F4822DRAFT_219416 [Hypoxylon trugodes]|uniref:uncharacterized protein n=1 Tax=Hypoxylon trugodes TaxID=326681 RepID=UPI002193D707|nr:uncharacterized protein F4822DRAFT_219416 [Hypoxylon trugodes]KAI1389964.1 hypothetical protein F4822DRAFT_219416 [Hypoxylon trugodes]